ncbi:ABC transporter ATP-binding protein [Nocardioides limicola]|uniref:ABC transporter ATP-binding protein n=1 Tax=Nocardioides limicola TaxID=2803368 RepID=UPI00193BB4FB|nr:ATP-binding cassette domain-containing protein [Nocardioides sp. DJM-14]
MSDRLEVDHVKVTHHGTVLVETGGLVLEPGTAVTVIGESGSGKSLLAHSLLGTLPPELAVTGAMRLDGDPFDLADPDSRRHLWGRELALLPQEPALALDPTMRVRRQVAGGLWKAPAAVARRRAMTALDEVGLAGAAESYPHTLSGGMAQRVAYAAATIGGARVLIVDEPSKGLDAAALDRLAALLQAHLAGGGLLLTITHDLGLARRLGGQVWVMREAEVVERGPVDQVLDAPSHPYTRRLLAADPSRWDWVPAAPTAGEPLVTATAVSKAYPGRPLFHDLSLQIRAGERWALTGPSGVGKTTLGNALAGLCTVDAGTITRTEALRRPRLQKLYQDPALSFPARVPLRAGLSDLVRRHRVDGARISTLAGSLGLDEALLDRRSSQVSGGELQRVAILRAMLVEPALIFADEATSRLDLLTQEGTLRCLMEEADPGCALLLVTHDQSVARALTDNRLELGEIAEPATSGVRG